MDSSYRRKPSQPWATHWAQPLASKTLATSRAQLLYCEALKRLLGQRIGTDWPEGPMRDVARHVFVPRVLEEPQSAVIAGTGAPAATGPLLSWLARYPALIISGEPGSGKTTLLQRFAMQLANGHDSQAKRSLPDHLPILISLAEFRNDPTFDELTSLEDLIFRQLTRIAMEAETELSLDDLEPFLSAGRWVLLLDGLDGLGAAPRRRTLVGWLREHQVAGECGYYVIAAEPSGLGDVMFDGDKVPEETITRVSGRLQGAYPRPDSDWEAAARASGRRMQVAPAAYGKVVQLQPLGADDVRTFCRGFFSLASSLPEGDDAGQGDAASRLAEAVATAVIERPEIETLGQRPDGLAMLARTCAAVGRVPPGRLELYERLVDNTLASVQAKSWPAAEVIKILAEMAYLAQDASGTTQDVSKRLFSWSRAELGALVRQVITQAGCQVLTADVADELVSDLLLPARFLVTLADDRICFGHLSVQEYLAALRLSAVVGAMRARGDEVTKFLFQLLARRAWHEVGVFFMAMAEARDHKSSHRALFSGIDWNKHDHVMWLASLLGCRDITFSAEERRLWVAWVTVAALTNMWRDLGTKLAGNPENRRAVAEWFVEMCAPWMPPGGEGSPVARLRRAMEQAKVEAEDTLQDQLADRVMHAPGADAAFIVRADAELAMAALLLADCRASRYVGDVWLAATVPQGGLSWVVDDDGDARLAVADSFWALNVLVDTDTRDLNQTLCERSHLAMRLVWTEADVAAWRQPRPVRAREWRMLDNAQATISLLMAITADIEAPRALAQARARARIPARLKAQKRAPVLAPALARARSLAGPRALVLARARVLELAEAQALYRAPELADALSLAGASRGAEALLRATELRRECELEKSHIAQLTEHLRRIAYLAESLLLEPGEPAALTRDRVQAAIDVFLQPSWLDFNRDEDPDRNERLKGELQDCLRLGLAPIDFLRAALEDSSLYAQPFTALTAIERALDRLESWCEQMTRIYC